MELTPVTERIVLHWGEMGTRWGVNRTVAQIHALLFMAEQPMTAEEIAETLSVARSNVSTSLRELQNWGLAKLVHQIGDRRDFFTGLQDRWEIFRLVVEGRKKREIDPTLTVVRDCVLQAEEDGMTPAVHEKLSNLLKFLETMSDAYERLRQVPPETMMQLIRLASSMKMSSDKTTENA